MVPKHFFHPDHIPPFSQLISALCKMTDCPVAQLLVEGNAARVGVGNAGIDIDDILLLQYIFQGAVQPGTDSGSPGVL